MIIRDESPEDWPRITSLLDRIFGGTYESGLVARLRKDALVVVALVAEEAGDVIGHIVLSALPVQVDGRPVRAVALAPLAVRADCQRRGVGSRLIKRALGRAKRDGIAAVIVVGHPAYYARFGFSAALAAKLASRFSGPAFMALELAPGTLSGVAGTVDYPAAFDD